MTVTDVTRATDATDATSPTGAARPDPPGVSRRAVLALLGVAVTIVASSGLIAWATPTDRVTADEPQYLLSASSLVRGGDLDIADEIEGERFRSFHATDLPAQAFRQGDDDPLLSPHEPGLPVLLALPVGLGGWVAAKIALAAMAGALAALTAWIAVVRLGVGLPLAVAVVGAFAVSAPLATYATQVYPEVPAALAVTAALAALTTPAATIPAARSALAPVAVAPVAIGSMAVAALPWLSLKYLPLAVVLAAGVCWTARQRPVVAIAAGATMVMTMVAALVVHHRLHGGWISFPGAAGPLVPADGRTVGLWGSEILGRSRRVGGLLVDEGFGLAAWTPAWLFVPLAAGAAVGWLRRSVRSRSGPSVDQVAAVVWPLVVLTVGWLVAVFAAPTMHGWWPPGRQVVVVAPAGVLLVAWVLEAWPALRMPFLVAAALGVATWSWTTAEAVTRVRTLVLDVGATTNPWYRLWRLVLPDGRSPGPGDEVLLAGWCLLLVAIVAAGVAIGRVRRV